MFFGLCYDVDNLDVFVKLVNNYNKDVMTFIKNNESHVFMKEKAKF